MALALLLIGILIGMVLNEILRSLEKHTGKAQLPDIKTKQDKNYS